MWEGVPRDEERLGDIVEGEYGAVDDDTREREKPKRSRERLHVAHDPSKHLGDWDLGEVCGSGLDDLVCIRWRGL